MNFSGRVSALLRHFALSAAVGISVLFIALGALGFLIFAYYTWLLTHFAVAEAAAITGGTLLAVSIVVAAVGFAVVKKLKKPQPSMLSAFGGTLGLGLKLATFVVRKDPKKAIILATISGAVAEYLLSDTKK